MSLNKPEHRELSVKHSQDSLMNGTSKEVSRETVVITDNLWSRVKGMEEKISIY